MKWIKIEDFKFDKTGEVLVIMNHPRKQNEITIINDFLEYTKYKKAKWYKPMAIKGNCTIIEENENYIQMWSFNKAKFNDVKAIAFMDDILKEYKEEFCNE